MKAERRLQVLLRKKRRCSNKKKKGICKRSQSYLRSPVSRRSSQCSKRTSCGHLGALHQSKMEIFLANSSNGVYRTICPVLARYLILFPPRSENEKKDKKEHLLSKSTTRYPTT